MNGKQRPPIPADIGADPQSSAGPAIDDAIGKIVSSSNYWPADEDLGFLQTHEARGLRLQLEYLKADAIMRRQRIANTIVVFGSTRIAERQDAERQVEESKRRLAVEPDNSDFKRAHIAAKRLLTKSKYYDVARDLGRTVGLAGVNHERGHTVIMTGGGPGIMEAANRGSTDVGALSIGLNITLPHEQFPNRYVTPNLCIQFRYFAMRKLHFALRAKALVVFPGGFGTMDELFEILQLLQTRKMPPIPVVLVGEDYWRKAFDADFLVEEGVIDAEDRGLYWFAETAESIWSGILGWHETRGTLLLEPSDDPP